MSLKRLDCHQTYLKIQYGGGKTSGIWQTMFSPLGIEEFDEVEYRNHNTLAWNLAFSYRVMWPFTCLPET